MEKRGKNPLRIALVTCPNPQLAVPTAHFSQGLLYVGGALRKAGDEVKIVDLRAVRKPEEIKLPEADWVGISATTGEIGWAKFIARMARAQGSLTMIGGAHATFMPQDCVDDFNQIVTGDGEIGALEAVKDLYSFKGKFRTECLTSLDGHFPDWSLIGEKGFSRELFAGEGYGQGPLAAGILSSRGCPYRCSYCRSERAHVRYRPIDEVVGEVIELQTKWGINHFRWYDESLTLNKARALELFSALAPLNIHIRAHTRSDAWDDERAAAFKKAGGEEMGFGFETCSNDILSTLRKQETIQQHREAVRVCKRAGITCKAFLMTSLPGETWDTIAAIKHFMAEERPEKYIVSRFCPYPGSDIWQHPERYGVKWMETDFGKFWNFAEEPLIEYEDISKEELQLHYEDLYSWLAKEFQR